MPSGYLPGAAVPMPMLARAAKTALIPPENFVGNLIFPDTQVDSFLNLAPLRAGREALEAGDDDTVGLRTDFKEVIISEGQYEFEIGAHARKVIIGQQSLMKAKQAARMIVGGGGSDPLFDLKARFTSVLLAQNQRRNEVLKIGQLLTTGNYPAGHVFDELDIEDSTLVRETIQGASDLIEDDGGAGPANLVVIGAGALSGLGQNTSLLGLLPPDAMQVITRDQMIQLLSLPSGSQVVFATARYRTGSSGTGSPMMDNYIWIGRVNPAQDGVNQTFGRNYWHPDDRNGQRVYVNQLVVGNQEDVHIGVINYYRPLVEDGNFGVLIPTTPPDVMT